MTEVKFNGGSPVVLCGKCNVILRYVRQDEDIALLCKTQDESCIACEPREESGEL